MDQRPKFKTKNLKILEKKQGEDFTTLDLAMVSGI
jgi:hypothetical protein